MRMGTAPPEGAPAQLSQPARRLLGDLIRPHRARLALVAAVTVSTSVLAAGIPLFVAMALDTGLPRAADGDPGPLVGATAGFLAVAVLVSLGTFLGIRLNAALVQRMMFALRTRLFRHVQRLSIGYHERSTSGRLVSRQASDMESVQQFMAGALIQSVMALVTMVAIAVMLVWLDPLLALVVFAGFVPLTFLTIWANRRQRAAYRATRTTIARVIVHVVETMGGIRAVQAFRREQRGLERLDEEDAAYCQANTEALQGMAWYTGGTRLIGNLSLAVIVLLGGWLVIGGDTEVGVLAAFLLSLRRFYAPLDELVQAFNAYQSAAAALEKIAEVLSARPDVPEPVSPAGGTGDQADAAPEDQTGNVPEDRPGSAGRGEGDEASPRGESRGESLRGEVRFEDVSFRYSASGAEVLPAFSLHVPAGQTVAMVGATGAGKSTLAKLLCRFYDPAEGRITLDGTDLRDLPDRVLRRRIVMVTQESYLFSGSVADNIRIGNPDAGMAEVVRAAQAVGLHDFVESLPQGYETDVKRRGGRLSSGQRQLVAFARVFLADPDVIVLDEATASLDIPGERLVQAALERVLAGRTALIIAHRLSTVAIADRVLVMKRGRIVEDGTPAELVGAGGEFASLDAAWRETLV
ncbi:ABC transporter ATP-binding protein [Sediminivirga luteola]|nr:ABC transporter ATP-binding protein [Sediminivirga luteola]